MRTFIILLITCISVQYAESSQQEPTKDELLATVRHIAAIAKQQQADLDSARAALTNAESVEIPKLKNAISDQATALATAQAQVVAKDAELKKAHSACWRNLLIGAGIGAVLVLLGPTLLKLLPMLSGI